MAVVESLVVVLTMLEGYLPFSSNQYQRTARSADYNLALDNSFMSQPSSQRRSWYDAYASVTEVAGSNLAQM